MSQTNRTLPRGFTSRNPTTGEVIATYEVDTDLQVQAKLQKAHDTFREYRHTSYVERSNWLRCAAGTLEGEKSELSRKMVLEMGKPIRAAAQEIEKCALACRYYAEHAPAFLQDETMVTGPARGFVRYLPLGAVLAVMPWNFPFWQVFRFAAPALMAGNVGLLKHASNVPGCALAIEEVLRKGGFPAGAFQTLMIGSDRVASLLEDPRISAATLTGSLGAGSNVAMTAGRKIKKTVLELGGSDPFIVMPSARLDQAVSTAVQARTVNNGQSCIAAKRFILHRTIASEFQGKFTERMAALKVGDPLEASTEIGPLATHDVLKSLEEQVDRTANMGAQVLLGGKRMDRPGYFYPPTVLARIPQDSPAYREELFGPVASLFVVDDLDEAIRLANDTPFGLGSSVWTEDERERSRFIDEIEAGMTFINGMVASDPRLPFGGIKESGYGRELSHLGIREFVNIKTVVVNEPRPRGGTDE
jgi:succinate-semialdehyde dehydrogenase / glutarate-semialdehyde dehydrogenase